jgi:hypothetical protein
LFCFQDGDDYSYEYSDFSGPSSADVPGAAQQSSYIPVVTFPEPPPLGRRLGKRSLNWELYMELKCSIFK